MTGSSRRLFPTGSSRLFALLEETGGTMYGDYSAPSANSAAGIPAGIPAGTFGYMGTAEDIARRQNEYVREMERREEEARRAMPIRIEVREAQGGYIVSNHSQKSMLVSGAETVASTLTELLKIIEEQLTRPEWRVPDGAAQG